MSEEQALLEESVARFVRDHCGIERQVAWRAGHGLDAVWREITELGWIGVSAPEEAGGAGGSGIEETAILAGIGRGLLTIAYIPCAVMAVEILGAAPAGADLLREVVVGERRLTVADDEPGRAYGQAPSTEVSEGGTGLVLRGRKSLVLGLDEADGILVSARDGATGEGVIVLIDAHDAGIRRRDVVLMDERRASDLDIEVEVPAENVLLRGDEADAALARASDRAAVAAAAEAVGAMRGAVELTREHLATRRQFGTALASFQALRHRFADMVLDLELTECLVTAAAASLDDPDQRSIMASAAKARAAKAGRLVGEAAVQLHGGIGLTAEYAVGQYYKRLMVLAALFGGGDDHRDRVGATYLSAGRSS